ncbi:UDP-N-acetylmuramoyl-L-alanyl-D-glutamate--2,6-diaminopimelate ligase [Atribacter laminatus]|uniref:UDP-N-acetylmuramoyl-L-alanyl-D-glutamate--2,6-diaminopimelate ligase n=1 Tax=Atribacter laminatus TaxID=2847778 RepID=A0A7T1AJ92_ATRLM|nr:UDP-N-acetylmuramoyl-L-alanyl-D-glutamate--2,6-diaminopimelate ligase [Atribacter laminatus]QPM66936.1 UDP-N-acetylmuramoyl-L-alanyl-D-glutamate--2,6-diaminopimelate ligase [Atribacter laminatus]
MILKKLFNLNEYGYKNIVDDQLKISGLAFDSRLVRPGYLFFAIPGINTDGHLYIEDAIKRGAAVIVYSDPEISFPPHREQTWIRVVDVRKTMAQISAQFYDHPSREMRLFGVTGTNGKTSTCFFLRNILEDDGHACGLMTTPKNIIGPDVYEAINTTEESLQIQACLKSMLNKGIRQAVLEVSSHGLALGRVDGLFFDAAVITNLVAEHLEFHKSFEHYFSSKKKLIEMVEQNTKKSYPRFVIVNGDDENCRKIITESHLPTFTFGLRPENDVFAEDIEYFVDRTEMKIKTPKGNESVQLSLPGQHAVYNALAATAMAIFSGIEGEKVAQGLEHTHRVPGRWEVVNAGQDFMVIVDFAHNWHGLDSTLSFIKKMVRGKVITVFGCGGERDRNKRPMMGETVARWSDICIITSDNPRHEDPRQTAEDAMQGVSKCKKEVPVESCIILDRREAISQAFSLAQAGDVVFLAGKGPERYQVYHDRIICHNDYDVALELLKERNSS